MVTRQLTPYDTGARLEPKVWVKKGITGSEYKRPAEDDDYGKVDFNNDEDATEAVVWMEHGSDGYTLRCYSMGDPIRVVQDTDTDQRPLCAVAEPLPEDQLLFLYEQIATAEDDGAKITFFTSPTRTAFSCEIVFPDGTKAEETLDLRGLLSDWATGMIRDHQAVRS
jgi:hypothetical protein